MENATATQATPYKFINKVVPYSTTADLYPVFTELNGCLNSEGVDITINDLIRTFDTYLRIVGIGKGVNDNPNDFCDIKSICGIIKCADLSEGIVSGEAKVEDYARVFDAIQETVADDRKFDDTETIKANLTIIFKELTIFVNDLFDYMANFYMSTDAPNIYSIHIINSHDNRELTFIVDKHLNQIDAPSVIISSDVFVSGKANRVSIIVDSFDPDNMEILEKAMNMDLNKEEAESTNDKSDN